MATPEEGFTDNPIAHVPKDGKWYPVRARENTWQGFRHWIATPEGQDKPCTYGEYDVQDKAAMRFNSEHKCQKRCDQLNKAL